jgi:tRNA threonylcarbamoyladenosine biosynthesis protein TsaE
MHVSEEKSLTCVSLKDLPQTVERLLGMCENAPPVWLFEGDMGAGKTTLIREICVHWGVTDHVSSPTFSIVNEYVSTQKGSIYHFDFYRIKDAEEAFAIGAEDYFYSGQPCLVEWPGRVSDLWPAEYLRLNIQTDANEHRTIYITEYHE